MSEPPALERSLFTEADLEILGFHDATVHALGLSAEAGELRLDLDYLLRWEEPAGDELHYRFWISPATLVFREVGDLRLGVALEEALSLDELRRETKAGGPDRYTLAFHEGELSLDAAGLELHLRRRPLRQREQALTLEARGERSFEAPGEWIDPRRLPGATQLGGVPVRGFTPGDEEAWLAMRGALWPDHDAAEHQAEMARWITRSETTVLFALGEAGQPIGFVELSERTNVDGCEHSPAAYLEGWWVEAKHRRQGVGAALVRAAEAWGRARGRAELASDAELENEASQRAHEALGFEAGDRVALYRKVL